ncbi:MAG: hypothetical protein JNK87_42845 [Bryobacterales bacterium]|nr:hypothetical protein [Bryobacterales bacterium]
MTTVKNAQRQIRRCEGFDVRFCYSDGKDVRDDKQSIPAYGYERAASENETVKWWRENRFGKRYAGYECEVLDGNGKVCHGGMLLRTVRESYGKS